MYSDRTGRLVMHGGGWALMNNEWEPIGLREAMEAISENMDMNA